jgi:hypothetical protein
MDSGETRFLVHVSSFSDLASEWLREVNSICRSSAIRCRGMTYVRRLTIARGMGPWVGTSALSSGATELEPRFPIRS